MQVRAQPMTHESLCFSDINPSQLSLVPDIRVSFVFALDVSYEWRILQIFSLWIVFVPHIHGYVTI
jgi:hypothetical protein